MKYPMLVVTAMAALFGAGQAAAADGKAVYEKSCAACHKVMSPKLVGDKAKWDPLIKKGTASMVASVVKGKGAMPPKGGAAALSDADIKAAVDYMVSQVK